MKTFFKHDMQTRTDKANEAEVERARNWAEVCRAVNLREEWRCRVCGKRTHPTSPSLLDRGHHHHIVYRSKGREDSVQNICLLCAQCHDAVHVKRTLAIEGNADEAPWLTISRRDGDGQWYIAKQECGVRIWERD